VDRWTSYREVWFKDDSAQIQAPETSTVTEIATYMTQNPSLQIGIDGSTDPSGTDAGNRDLSDRRVRAIRDALVEAGVSPSKIKTGAFGDPQLRRDRRVEVLIATAN